MEKIEIICISLVVRSPRPLPLFTSEAPFPGLFPGIFAIEAHHKDHYIVSCSTLSIFSVSADLVRMAEMYEASQVSEEEPMLI